MSKIFKTLIRLGLFSLICLSFQIYSYAKIDVSAKDNDYYSFSYVSEVIKNLEKMNFLSDEEKIKIREESKSTYPHYNKIIILENRAKKISDRIMKSAKPLNKKYDTIYSGNKKLWPILENEFKDSSDRKNLTRVQMLVRSTKLTDEEKNILREDAAELDDLDIEISKIQDRADKAVSKLLMMIDKEWESLDDIYEESKVLWEKIIDNFEVKK